MYTYVHVYMYICVYVYMYICIHVTRVLLRIYIRDTTRHAVYRSTLCVTQVTSCGVWVSLYLMQVTLCGPVMRHIGHFTRSRYAAYRSLYAVTLCGI